MEVAESARTPSPKIPSTKELLRSKSVKSSPEKASPQKSEVVKVQRTPGFLQLNRFESDEESDSNSQGSDSDDDQDNSLDLSEMEDCGFKITKTRDTRNILPFAVPVPKKLFISPISDKTTLLESFVVESH